MSIKIHSEISSINEKIDGFKSQMSATINTELAKLRENIYQVINKIFNETEKSMK